jgi:hypothetical protein
MRSKPGPPMTLANMRANGVRAVTATCANGFCLEDDRVGGQSLWLRDDRAATLKTRS